jgi:hypothetical protein
MGRVLGPMKPTPYSCPTKCSLWENAEASNCNSEIQTRVRLLADTHYADARPRHPMAQGLPTTMRMWR